MIVLVSGATGTHKRFWEHPAFGHLVTPRTGNSVAMFNDKPWAADNDAFNGWDRQKELAFSKMLGRICLEGNRKTLKFITMPDVVGDAKITAERFDAWEPIVHASKLPVALVAQDGINDVPWDRIEALFIGGSTAFKMSRDVDGLIAESRRRGRWVHVGRVNTYRRVRHFHDVGVDSIDGTAFSRWGDTYFPLMIRWLARLEPQKILEGFAA